MRFFVIMFVIIMSLSSVTPSFGFNKEKLLKNLDYSNYQEFLLYPSAFAVALFFLRLLLERIYLKRAGLQLGLKTISSKKQAARRSMEKGCSLERKWSRNNLSGIAKQLDWMQRKIQRWFKFRNLIHKRSKLNKFCESSWRLLFYTSMLVYGLTIVWDKEWFWTLEKFYTIFRDEPLSRDIWLLHMIMTGHYLLSMISALFVRGEKYIHWKFVYNACFFAALTAMWLVKFQLAGAFLLVTDNAFMVFFEAVRVAKRMKSMILHLIAMIYLYVFYTPIWTFILRFKTLLSITIFDDLIIVYGVDMFSVLRYITLSYLIFDCGRTIFDFIIMCLKWCKGVQIDRIIYYNEEESDCDDESSEEKIIDQHHVIM